MDTASPRLPGLLVPSVTVTARATEPPSPRMRSMPRTLLPLTVMPVGSPSSEPQLSLSESPLLELEPEVMLLLLLLLLLAMLPPLLLLLDMLLEPDMLELDMLLLLPATLSTMEDKHLARDKIDTNASLYQIKSINRKTHQK